VADRCGCTRFIYKTTESAHVPGTGCGSCGHRRNSHEDYIDNPIPCAAASDRSFIYNCYDAKHGKKVCANCVEEHQVITYARYERPVDGTQCTVCGRRWQNAKEYDDGRASPAHWRMPTALEAMKESIDVAKASEEIRKD
jgi:hypothetical protein